MHKFKWEKSVTLLTEEFHLTHSKVLRENRKPPFEH